MEGWPSGEGHVGDVIVVGQNRRIKLRELRQAWLVSSREAGRGPAIIVYLINMIVATVFGRKDT